MPFIAPIIAGIAGFIGLAGTAATIFTSVATTALAVGASLLANKLLAPPKAKTPPRGVEFDVRLGGDVFREIPFGRVATAGHLVYFNLFPSSTNKTLQLVYVLADWQCESLDAVWVDGEKKALTAVAAADGASATYEVAGYGTKLKIWWHSGASGQAVNTRLSANDNPAGRWNATDTLDGMCYVLVEAVWDEDLFPGGRPDLLFEIKGARLYDPRLDGTAGGVGTHRWADPTTWEWSENPAVGLYNFQRGFYRGAERILGMGIPAARLIADDYFAAMNVCDEPLSEGGSTVARYTGALVVSEEHEHRVAIEGFLSAMAGRHAEQAGYHRIVAGAAQSSVATITQNDLIEGRPVSWSAHRGRDQLVNAVYGTFTSPADGWQPVGYEPVIVPAWEAEDGAERIVRTLDLAAVTRPHQANRIAVLRANEHRFEAQGSITVGCKFLAVAPLDWITFENDAGGSRTYRVGRRRLNPDLTIELEIEEVGAAAYGGAVVVTVPVVTKQADFAPITTVTGFAVAAVEVVGSDGQKRPGLRFTWTPPDDPTVDLVRIQYRVVGSTDRIRIIDPTPEDGVIVAVEGVLASTNYEARASIVTTPRRATTWTAWTPVTSTSGYLVKNVIAGAIAELQLADAAVTAAKLAVASVSTEKIVDTAVISAKLAALSVTEAKVAASAITTAKIAAAAVEAGNIAAAAVTSAKLADLAVSAAKIADGAVSNAKVASRSLAADRLLAKSLTLNEMAIGNFDNLVQNPGGELGKLDPHSVFTNGGALGWSAGENAATARSGNWRILYDTDGQTSAARLNLNGALTDKNAHPVATEGDQFYLEGWVRSVGTLPLNRATLRLLFRDISGGNVGFFSTFHDPTGPYAKVSVSGVAPAGAAFVVFELVVENDGNHGAGKLVLFDDLYARRMLDEGTIVDSAITTAKLGALAVTEAKVAASAITTAKLAASAVEAGNIAASAVTNAKLASAAVDAAKLANGAVGLTKFASGITPVEILGALPTTGNFDGRQVFLTTDKKLYRYDATAAAWTTAVPAVDITGTITSTQLGDLSVTAAKVAASAVTTAKLADAAVATAKIASGAVVAANIAANTITAAQIAADTITAAQIAGLTITATEIAADAINATKILAGSVTTVKIATNAVTANEIAANTITAAQIAAGAISATELAAGAVVADKIAAGAIVAEKLAVGTAQNWLRNSDFQAGLTHWGFSQSGTEHDVSSPPNAGSTWQLQGDGSTVQVRQNGIDTAAYADLFYGDSNVHYSTGIRLPVNAGVRYQLSAYLNLHRCDCRIYILFYDAADVAITFPSRLITSAEAPSGTSGQTIDNYTRLNLFHTAPANAAFARILIRKYGTLSGTTSFLFATRLFFGEAHANQTVPSPWSPSAVTLIQNGHIATDAVTSAKILAGSITTAKLAAGSVTATEIASGAVVTAKLDALAVTAQKIATDAVEASKILAGAVTAGKIASLAITTDHLAANAVTAAKIAAGTITANEVAAGAIGTTALAAEAVTAGKIAARSIGTEKLFVGNFDNLIQNPGGELGTLNPHVAINQGGATGWSAPNNPTNARSGNYRINYDTTGQTSNSRLGLNGNAANANAHPTAADGDQFHFEAWVKAFYTPPNRALLRLSWRNADATQLGVTDTIYTPTGTWTRVSVSGAAPAGTAFVAAELYVLSDGNAGGHVAFDDLYMRRMVTGSVVVDGTIQANHIAANTITAAQIAANTITATQIASGTITAAQIAALTITASEIATDAVTAAKILAGSVVAAKIASLAVTAGKIDANAVTATEIASGSVTTVKLAAGAVTASEIAADAVTSAKIVSGAITAVKVAAGAIIAEKIATNAITTDKIILGGVTTTKIETSAVTDSANVEKSTQGTIASDTDPGPHAYVSLVLPTVSVGKVAVFLEYRLNTGGTADSTVRVRLMRGGSAVYSANHVIKNTTTPVTIKKWFVDSTPPDGNTTHTLDITWISGASIGGFLDRANILLMTLKR